MRLRVTTDDGESALTDEDTATVTVNNVAPTATFGNNGPVNEGSSFTLSLTSPVDPGTADTFTYAFDCGDGSGDGAFSTSNSTVCPTTDNGVRAVKGTIKDKDGGTNEYTDSVTVNNVAPTATFGNNGPVNEGISFTLSLTSPVDPGTADTFTYAFDCGDGSGYGALSASNSVVCPTTDNGVRAVKGTIKDKDGGTNEYTDSVTVNNVAPTVNAGPDLFGYEGNEVVLSDPTFTDPGTADTHTATIDWGDGTVTDPATLTEPASPGTVTGQHVYGIEGDFTVTVCVKDDDKDQGCDSLQVSVSPAVRFRGTVYNGPLGDTSLSLPGVVLHVYGASGEETLPGALIATHESQLSGYFNFYIIDPWFYDTFTLIAESPEGMAPLAAWSEDGTVLDSQTVQWDAPTTTVHENIFTFETTTVAPSELVTDTITLPLLADTWLTWGDQNGNYDGYGSLIVRPTGLDNALLKFDRSALPRNATILSAELTVNVSGQTGADGKQLAVLNVDPYTPVLVSYAEAPAAYNPGAAVDVSLAFGPLMLDVAAQVQAWNAPAFTSYHWGYLALSATGPAGRISLDSLESSPGTPATLTVTYTSP